MIIKSMEQFGKALDDGVEMEYTPTLDNLWQDFEGDASLLRYRELIEARRIRTKPRTVTVRVYTNGEGGEPIDVQMVREQHITPWPCSEDHEITLRD